MDRVQAAIQLTQQSTTNITAAHDACRIWTEILCNSTIVDSLSPSIQFLSHALHASCWVRVGQDVEAIGAYNRGLMLHTTKSTTSSALEAVHTMIMGKAKSLQRLLRYNEAAMCFVDAGGEDGIVGAAICLFRQAKLCQARQLLYNHLKNQPNDELGSAHSWETSALLEVLRFQRDCSDITLLPITIGEGTYNILNEAANRSPVYAWIITHLCNNPVHPLAVTISERASPFTFRQFCAVNTYAFDDPLLRHLDDKILLHRLLTATPMICNQTKNFWPPGWICSRTDSGQAVSSPRDLEDKPDESSMFILKHRAGYGSHGNTFVWRWSAAQQRAQEMMNKENFYDDELLIQRVIQPPLTVRGSRRFSLRVYIVLIPNANQNSTGYDLYIGTEGLVKLAAVAINDTSKVSLSPNDAADLARIHATNSGRELGMEQKSLEWLRRELNNSATHPNQWNEFWDAVVDVTSTVMNVFGTFRTSHLSEPEYLDHIQLLSLLRIPKILGFDFVVQHDFASNTWSPWLVEVNRFPGLEPRDQFEHDGPIKTKVVFDAWSIAISQMPLTSGTSSYSWFQNSFNNIAYVSADNCLSALGHSKQIPVKVE